MTSDTRPPPVFLVVLNHVSTEKAVPLESEVGWLT